MRENASEYQELNEGFFDSLSLATYGVVTISAMLAENKVDKTLLPELSQAFEAEIDRAGCTTSTTFQERYNERFLRRIGTNKKTIELATMMIKSSPAFEEIINKDPDAIYSFIANPQEFLGKNPDIVVETLNIQNIPMLSRECLANSKIFISDLVNEPSVIYTKIKDGPESFLVDRKDIQEEFKVNFAEITEKYRKKAKVALSILDNGQYFDTMKIYDIIDKQVLTDSKTEMNLTQDELVKVLIKVEQDSIPKLVESVCLKMKDELDKETSKEKLTFTDKVLANTNLILKHTHEDALEKKDSSISKNDVNGFLSRESSFSGKLFARKISSKLTEFISSQMSPFVNYVKAKEEHLEKNPESLKQHKGLEKVLSKVELSDIPKIVKAMGGAKKLLSLVNEARKFCKEVRDNIHVNKDAEDLSITRVAFSAVMKVVLEREGYPEKQYTTHAIDEAIELISKKTKEIKERKQGKSTSAAPKKDVKSLVAKFREKFASTTEVKLSSKNNLTPQAVASKTVASNSYQR